MATNAPTSDLGKTNAMRNDPGATPKPVSTPGATTSLDRGTSMPAPEAEKTDAGKDGMVASARETIKEQIDTGSDKVRQSAANLAQDSADQVKEAGDAFDSGSWARMATHRIADNLSDAANSMREADLDALQDDLTAFARRQPLLFFGGAALLGFAAARMLKASERAEHGDQNEYVRSRYQSPAEGPAWDYK